MARVMGVDASKGGWFGLVLDPTGHTAHVAGGIAELVALAEADGPLDAIGIDIPIGLPDRSRRRADQLARQAVGPRRVSSVYMTPVRAALMAGTHDDAVARNRELVGEGVSDSGIRPAGADLRGRPVGTGSAAPRRRGAPGAQLRHDGRRATRRFEENLGRRGAAPSTAGRLGHLARAGHRPAGRPGPGRRRPRRRGSRMVGPAGRGGYGGEPTRPAGGVLRRLAVLDPHLARTVID